MAAYPADPGAVFESDVHRRVMASVPSPDENALSIEDIHERIGKDDYLDIDVEELVAVVKDLEGDEHVVRLDDGWKNTIAGFEALSDQPWDKS